jgi:predicted porin
MKKLLIASAALAMVAGTAQAQSSVTIYGIIDANTSSTKQQFSEAGTANVGLASSAKLNSKSSGVQAVDDPTASSRLGFRGTEDLGGGLAANFNVELDMTVGGGEAVTTTNARTSTVGLSDKSMGTINVGRQLTGVHGTVAGFNPLAGNNMVGDMLYSSAFRAHSVSNLNAQFVASGVGATSVGNTNGTLNAVNTIGVDSVRMNRGISYVSPVMSGFTARVDYAQDKTQSDLATANTETSVKHQGLTVNYAGGPVRVAASTHTAKADIATDGTAVSELKIDAISAAYQLTPAISLQASYAESQYLTSGAMTSETKAFRLGANYNVGKWVFAAQYGQGDVSTPLANADANLGKATAADRTAYQMAAFYNLSKRTALYAAYGQQEQKITNQANNAAANASMTTAIGDKVKYTQTAVGVRHSF